jgi:DNA-binding NtrC family response regulator
MKSISVLVADDEESIRSLLEHWLRTAKHDVVGASCATEAYAALTKRSFELVITDILMPDGDGLDLIAKLKAVQPSTRILAISGGGRWVEGDDCLKLARGLGAHAVVMKPFTWDQLQAGMEQALGPAAPAL